MAVRETTYARLERVVRRWLRKAQLQRAIDCCEAELETLPGSEYQQALGRSWLSQTREVARWLAGFYRTASKAGAVRALYCEMNRFEINPDEWYVDAFAYDSFGGAGERGWLVEWNKTTADGNRLVLRGMADLQLLFERDYGDEPPSSVRAASEVAILLLSLRMQELINAAAAQARESGRLKQDVPVLAAVHDSDIVHFSYGQVRPRITRVEPKRPIVRGLPKPGSPHGIYKMDGGWDKFYNSLPWDRLDYFSDREEEKLANQLDTANPLARNWKVPRVKLRRRRWRCDLIELYPHWTVNEKAKVALQALVGKIVEFLPLRCAEFSNIWVMHPLRHLDLAPEAVHNTENGSNMTRVDRYVFQAKDLRGKHLFGIKQAPGSPARKGGLCYGANYVSEEFRRIVKAHGLQGVTFKKVFSYYPS